MTEGAQPIKAKPQLSSGAECASTCSAVSLGREATGAAGVLTVGPAGV